MRDVVRAYKLALQNGKVGKVYNICSERSMTIREVLHLFLKLSGKTIRVVEDPGHRRDLEIPQMIGDGKKIKTDTGWESRIPLEQTLADLLNYWRKALSSSSAIS